MKIGLCFYYVGDITEANQLYSRFLGCDPYIREPDWIRFHLDGGDLALHLDPKLPKTSSNESIRFGGVVSLTVTDLTQTLAQARQLGFRQVGEVQLEGYGKLAEIRDPWGNRFSLIEPSVPG